MNQANRGEWISDSDVDRWDLELMACITRWFQLHVGHGIERHVIHRAYLVEDYSIPFASNREYLYSNFIVCALQLKY